MTCPACRTLNPHGARHCLTCGAELPASHEPERAASSYFGRHVVHDADGKAVRALLDFGPKPAPNLLVGLAILVAFALSAIGPIVAAQSRQPERIARIVATWEEQGLTLYIAILGDDGMPMRVTGDARVAVWMATTQAELDHPRQVAQCTTPVRRQDFRLVRYVQADPTTGFEEEGAALMGRLGPMLATELSAVPRGWPGPLVCTSLEVRTAEGVALQARTKWQPAFAG